MENDNSRSLEDIVWTEYKDEGGKEIQEVEGREKSIDGKIKSGEFKEGVNEENKNEIMGLRDE